MTTKKKVILKCYNFKKKRMYKTDFFFFTNSRQDKFFKFNTLFR